jgi:hypothetical protein
MLAFERRKKAFVQLGSQIGKLLNRYNDVTQALNEFQQVIQISNHENQWFIEENIHFALENWQNSLSEENIDNWLKAYDFSTEIEPKTIGLIMAGNIPLVGFHDFLSVLICGHRAKIKLSSSDKRLLPYLSKLLIEIEPAFEEYILFEEHTIKGFDAIIATGSNNTSRYFEYYFRNKPHIIRKNRNGICILDSTETAQDFQNLGKDIFRYFGLGCRNVSKLFVPKNYDFKPFFEGISNFESYIHNHKYANNYDYNKAVYLMSDIDFKDNGFLILKKDTSITTPIAVLNYEEYENDANLKNSLKHNKENIQCIIGNHHLCDFKFGEAQEPKLNDYADGIDTIKFLKQLDTPITL